MQKYPTNYLIYKGSSFMVEWYYTEQGKMPAYEYFQIMNEKTQRRFLYMVKYLADSPKGEFLPKSMLNIENREEKIYALKPDFERFFTFMFTGGKVIITNAYHKHSQQMARKDKKKLEIAIKYKQNYTKRIKEGTYYE